MKNMRRKMRKEITLLNFEGVAVDGEFVFSAECMIWDNSFTKILATKENETLFLRIGRLKLSEKIYFRMLSYEEGLMEIAVDAKESISTVAEMVTGVFSKCSNFANLDLLVLNYRNICLKIGRNMGRKDIISMLMKAMSMQDYQRSDNEIAVETAVQPLPEDVAKFDFVEIPTWYTLKKVLCFKNAQTGKLMLIAVAKDGVIIPEFCAGGKVSKTIEGMKKLFSPVSNLYGIKAVELQMNHFEYSMDKDTDIGHLYHLFVRAMSMDTKLSMLD